MAIRAAKSGAQASAPRQISELLTASEADARTARRTNKSLRGSNSYADKFHESRTGVMRLFRELKIQLAPTADAGLLRTLDDVEKQLGFFYEPKTSDADRRDLRRQIDFVLGSEIEPASKTLRALTPDFIPYEAVSGTPEYIIEVTRQANGCFTDGYLDACGVMIRRLLETLIIEVFEKKGLADEIRNRDGEYLMFSDLVKKLINTKPPLVGKTSRRDLTIFAPLLNNCAHNRYFNITRPQLAFYQPAIVVVVQELITNWGIRAVRP